jgi:hypothetical protein
MDSEQALASLNLQRFKRRFLKAMAMHSTALSTMLSSSIPSQSESTSASKGTVHLRKLYY